MSASHLLPTLSKEDRAYIRTNIPCQAACPVLTNVPSYIKAIYDGDFATSYEINRTYNLFPGVLGRICSRPCEKKCRHGEHDLGDPVNICHLKRAASDFSPQKNRLQRPRISPSGKKVCIVGAGPAGLTAAHDLALSGVEVTVLEAMEEPGGMLRYGIPQFRLPRHVLREEIDAILDLGIDLQSGVRIGKDKSLSDLEEEFDALLIAIGCYDPLRLGIPGEDLPGVYAGLEFMMDVCSGRSPGVGGKVLVIGAGFTAFDCARTALRLGAREVSICLRRTEEDLTVTSEEIIETKKEGIAIQSLMLAREIKGQGRVQAVTFVKTRPTTLRRDGKQEIEPIKGSEFDVEADTVIVATGQRREPLPAGSIASDSTRLVPAIEQFKTPVRGIYATGDYVTGPSTVIEAIASGRKAASVILQDLGIPPQCNPSLRLTEAKSTHRKRNWDFIPREPIPTVKPLEERLSSPAMEVEKGLHQEAAVTESKRCYLCYLYYEIDITRCIYCRYCIDVAPRDCIKMVKEARMSKDGMLLELVETSSWNQVAGIVIDNHRCIRCGECMRVCPVNCISVSRVELLPGPWPHEEYNG